MPVLLAEAARGAQTDLDTAVINEFRKSSAILDALIFDDVVNPAGGGATLTYGYRRQITQSGAAFRQLNTEYVPSEITTQQFVVNLAPLGGSYQIDRVIADIGPAAANENVLNMQEKIRATNAKFSDAVINGDTAVEAYGFDGLDKALTGSTTELGLTTVTNWTDFDTNARAEYKALDLIDEFLGLLDGAPTLIIGNATALARVRAAARRSGMYQRNAIDDLVGTNGRPIEREQYGGLVFVDAGEVAGSSNLVVPIETRTVGGVSTTGLTDLYAVRIGLDGFHAVSTVGGNIVRTWLPNFQEAGAVKTGEVELGPVAVALKRTKASAVLRNVKVR